MAGVQTSFDLNFMNKLLLAVILSSSTAHAASCPQAHGVPCTPSALHKEELLSQIEELTLLSVSVSALEQNWIAANGSGDREKMLETYEAYNSEKARLYRLSDSLVHAVESAYNVAPERTAAAVRRPTTPGRAMDWVSNLSAEWRPQLTFANDEIKQYRTPDGKKRYTSTNVAGVAGNTYFDGAVTLSAEILKDALQDKNPGIIAQVIFHERIHFERLTTTGWSYREVEEERAYTAVIANAGTFELSPAWIKVQESALAAYQDAIRNKRLTTFSISLADQRSLEEAYDGIGRARASLDEYYAKLKEQVSAMRAQAEAERRQSDQRLRLALADAVIRACSSPGSVDQAEFDDLGHPHNRDFLVDEQGNIPEGLGENGALFMELAWTLRDGKRIDAAHVALRCATAVPIPLNPQRPGPPRVNPIPEVAKASVPFASMLPSVKRLAVSACQDQASISTRFFLPRLNISFSISDDQAIGNYLAWLGECERGVFNDIVAQIRSGQGRMIDDQWVRQRGAAHYVAPPSAGPGVSPPTGPDHEEVWRRLKPIVPRR